MDSPQEEDLFDQIDWDSFLDQLPDQTLQLDDDPPVAPTADHHHNRSPNSVLSEIENLLFADDDVQHSSSDTDYDKLLADILVDEPLPPPPPRGESDDGSSPSDGGDSDKDRVVAVTREEEDEDATVADDESLSKKQKRQMRNRDAAVKSRERKKLYVKDLEIKSRYYEGECRRLGHLLQCCYAENHALRLCLQSRGAAFGAPMTMQESAVLLLGMSSELRNFYRIPAAGFPAVVHGHHVPTQSTPDAVVNRSTSKRKHGTEERSKKGGSKRTRNLDHIETFCLHHQRVGSLQFLYLWFCLMLLD
ncbi:hypothetical protein RIF29_18388 [Crotalaria pallida]|uniref:BZIP domain-containing protein n=1 Tax=Crotalaria pallida TaxID=3830 RepID=A0AAN9IFF1_CROPI